MYMPAHLKGIGVGAGCLMESRLKWCNRKLLEVASLFCRRCLQGGLDLVAEPESGDRQGIQDIYSQGLFLTLLYPAPSLGRICPTKTA